MNAKSKFGVKEVVAVGIGAALFVALTNVQVPLGIPNTALQPRAALLAFLSAVFGPIVGAAVGIIGHALGDMFFYGSAWVELGIPGSRFCHCRRRICQSVRDSGRRIREKGNHPF